MVRQRTEADSTDDAVIDHTGPISASTPRARIRGTAHNRINKTFIPTQRVGGAQVSSGEVAAHTTLEDELDSGAWTTGGEQADDFAISEPLENRRRRAPQVYVARRNPGRTRREKLESKRWYQNAKYAGTELLHYMFPTPYVVLGFAWEIGTFASLFVKHYVIGALRGLRLLPRKDKDGNGYWKQRRLEREAFEDRVGRMNRHQWDQEQQQATYVDKYGETEGKRLWRDLKQGLGEHAAAWTLDREAADRFPGATLRERADIAWSTSRTNYHTTIERHPLRPESRVVREESERRPATGRPSRPPQREDLANVLSGLTGTGGADPSREQTDASKALNDSQGGKGPDRPQSREPRRRRPRLFGRRNDDDGIGY